MFSHDNIVNLINPVQIQGLAAGGIVLVLLLYKMSAYISRWIQDRTLFYIFKYLVYPILIQRRRFLGPLNRYSAFCIGVYWISTAACNIVGVRTLPQAGNRAGSLAVLHLVPLLFSGRLSFAADLLGFSLQTYFRLHNSIGIMAFTQTFIHITIFLANNAFLIHDSQHFYGLLVCMHCC